MLPALSPSLFLHSAIPQPDHYHYEHSVNLPQTVVLRAQVGWWCCGCSWESWRRLRRLEYEDELEEEEEEGGE
jgi:hypothetical protein